MEQLYASVSNGEIIENTTAERVKCLEARIRGIFPSELHNENEPPKNLGLNFSCKPFGKKKIDDFEGTRDKKVKFEKKFFDSSESSADSLNFLPVKNNKKITDYFGNGGKSIREVSKAELEESSKFEDTIFSIKNENVKLNKELNEVIRLVQSKDSQIEVLKQENQCLLAKNSQYKSNIQEFEQNFFDYKKQLKDVLLVYVKTCEKLRKSDIRNKLLNQKYRLGEFICQRDGARFNDVWIEGQEYKDIKEKLMIIFKEKEEIDKQKKKLKSKKTKRNTLENCFEKSNQDSIQNFIEPEEIQRFKDKLAFRIEMLTKEEMILKEKLDKLDKEKIFYIQESRRIFEEDHSRFGKVSLQTSQPSWILLQNKYQLLSFIGKGGFSEVYKAFDCNEMKEVACKIHQLNPIWSERNKANYIKHAIREANIHKELNNDNIVKLYDNIEIDSNSFCTVLEYCEGPDLSTYLKIYKQLSEKESKLIIYQILNGIRYLHENQHKIIHYDLKPQNILFHRGEVKISDFGLSKIMEDEDTKMDLTSQGVGTYWYLPPECFETGDKPPKISQKVDIWSIGVILFEMLFGIKPFGNEMSQERIFKEIVNFPAKPTISTEAKDFIKKCLEYDQDQRMNIQDCIIHPFIQKNKQQFNFQLNHQQFINSNVDFPFCIFISCFIKVQKIALSKQSQIPVFKRIIFRKQANLQQFFKQNVKFIKKTLIIRVTIIHLNIIE